MTSFSGSFKAVSPSVGGRERSTYRQDAQSRHVATSRYTRRVERSKPLRLQHLGRASSALGKNIANQSHLEIAQKVCRTPCSTHKPSDFRWLRQYDCGFVGKVLRGMFIPTFQPPRERGHALPPHLWRVTALTRVTDPLERW